MRFQAGLLRDRLRAADGRVIYGLQRGAGVQVSPNASRVLHGLGLSGELARTGVKPLAFHQRRWDDGRTLLRSPLGERLEATFGFPHYQMHRAGLLTALAGAVPAERVHLGHRLTGLTDHGDRVEDRFDARRIRYRSRAKRPPLRAVADRFTVRSTALTSAHRLY